MVDRFTLCRRVKDSLWASGVPEVYALAGRHGFEQIEGAANVTGDTGSVAVAETHLRPVWSFKSRRVCFLTYGASSMYGTWLDLGSSSMCFRRGRSHHVVQQAIFEFGSVSVLESDIRPVCDLIGVSCWKKCRLFLPTTISGHRILGTKFYEGSR